MYCLLLWRKLKQNIMSWGTTVNNVFVLRAGKNVEAEIEESESFLQKLREDLIMFAAATPREVSDSEGNPMQWEEYISLNLGEIIESYGETVSRLTMIRLIEESLPEDIIEDD